MSRSIDYYFSMASPWAYLGHARFLEIAAAHGATVRFCPVPLGQLFPETGGLPLPKRHPVRQRYRLVELQRWSARRGLPLVPQPRPVRFDPALLDRAVTRLILDGQDPDATMRRAFHAIWVDCRDLADPAEIDRVAGAPGLAERAGAPEVAARYDAMLTQALAADVFGSPSYVLDGEVFWGQDRLELLDDALASGRAAYRP